LKAAQFVVATITNQLFPKAWIKNTMIDQIYQTTAMIAAINGTIKKTQKIGINAGLFKTKEGFA
jgi:polyribonucleotide nucleotidyltransferase